MAADVYPAAQSASFAVRTIRPALKWAAHRGHLSPALANLHSPAPVRRRRRVLDRYELAALLPILRAGANAHPAALRFAALTGHADVYGLHWRQIDLSTGTLTYRTKLRACGEINASIWLLIWCDGVVPLAMEFVA